MRIFFYAGIILLALFEVFKVYYIMPMPGSQEMESIDVAYFLHTWRWPIRIFCCALVVVGIVPAFSIQRKWIPFSAVSLVVFTIYLFNFEMTAEQMFRQPGKLSFASQHENQLSDSTVVIAVVVDGETKAFPIRYLVYHHQVRDIVAGKPVMVTYCSVCRTGRVYEPLVNGELEEFRLVGMDHFNAMFEDATTGSWWRQVNGQAIAGPLKGKSLSEVPSFQVTLRKLFDQYPFAQVMQPDEVSTESYDTLGKFEYGKSKSALTRTDSLSWEEKSWVVGVEMGGHAKAYDWNNLKEERVINDYVGDTPITLVISNDNQSFMVFRRPELAVDFRIVGDTIFSDSLGFNLHGHSLDSTAPSLERLKAYQEFWHSWRTFHPETEQYGIGKDSIKSNNQL